MQRNITIEFALTGALEHGGYQQQDFSEEIPQMQGTVDEKPELQDHSYRAGPGRGTVSSRLAHGAAEHPQARQEALSNGDWWTGSSHRATWAARAVPAFRAQSS